MQSLTIIDPLNPDNNIGKSTFNFMAIKDTFAAAHDRMLLVMNTFQSGQTELLQSVLQDPMAPSAWT